MPDYRDRAACRNQDPERWFPISPMGAELDPHPVAVCHLCPVQLECLTDATRHGHRHGTWGGLTQWQRENQNVVRATLHVLAASDPGSETPIAVGGKRAQRAD